ncbi:MAG TPA: hypothetical protein PKD12_18075 [Nitrospira sp.]|nr:hypothetical protein [Nitrospira sp.]
MPKHTAIGSSLCVFFLIFSSCGDPGYQIRHPQGYGETPPGATWVAIDSAYQSPSREMVYCDPNTIRRDGHLVALWQLIDYQMMQGNAPFGIFMMSPHRFLSTKTHKEFDCTHHTVRLLASTEFSQHMGTGTRNAVLVEQGDGQPVKPGSINQAIWELACNVVTTPK